jgi:hypothetical protein
MNNNFSIQNKTLLVCAKRASGKSELVRYLVKNELHQFKKVFVFSPTEAVHKFYGDFVSPETIYHTYEDGLIEKMIEKLSVVNSNKTKHNASHILVILDDLISDIDFHHANGLKKLFSRGRHIFITTIVISQYIYAVPPIVRTNADYIFCGQQNKRSVEILTDEFLSPNMEKEEFVKMYANATKNYGFLVINQNSISDLDNVNEMYGIVQVPKETLKNK